MAGIQDIRKNLSGPVAKVISWAIIVTFALFFGWGTVFSGSDLNNVVTVNEKKIDVFDLQSEMSKIQQQIRDQFQNEEIELDQELLKQLAINSLINNAVISSYLEGEGLSISDENAFKVLSLDPSLVDNGSFNKERFDLIALQSGLSPSKLLENFKDEMVRRYWAIGLGQTQILSTKTFKHNLQLTNQTRDITFTRLDFSEEKDNIKITEESLKDYFNSNQNLFLTDEEVSLSYIEISSDQFLDQIIPVDQIEAEYKAYLDEFDSSTRKKASHLMVNLKEKENKEEALVRIKSIASKLNENNFSEIVSEFSEDEGSKNNGGELGISDGSLFPEEFEQVLNELEVGEVSNPVFLADSNSYHVIKLTERISPEPESFDEMKSKIESNLITDIKEVKFSELLEEAADLSFSLEDLGAISTELELEIIDLDPFSIEGTTGLFAESSIQNILTNRSLLQGETSELIELSGDKALIFRVNQYLDPALKEFEEVRFEVESLYASEEAEKSFSLKEQNLLEKIESSESFQQALTEQGLKSETYKSISRNSSLFPRAVLDDVFEISRSEIGKGVYSSSLVGGDKIIFLLDSINLPTEVQETPEQQIEFKNFLNEERAQSYLTELQDSLKKEADIVTKEVTLN